jgi:hypothetical protein
MRQRLLFLLRVEVVVAERGTKALPLTHGVKQTSATITGSNFSTIDHVLQFSTFKWARPPALMVHMVITPRVFKPPKGDFGDL